LRRKLEIKTKMYMPIDIMSIRIDETISFENSMSMSMTMPFFVDADTEMSMPSFSMSMPACNTAYTCPDAGTCNCGGQVHDGGEICGCYTISSVDPPFDTSDVPASGTWYCYQVDLDKSVKGCSGAKPVSHAVLPTGFSHGCHFFKGGQDLAGSDKWFAQTCDNTAATGLKFDFGHSGSGNQLSVTYCIDVSCEAAPVGKGSIHWVLTSGNDRCDIKVTEGAVPSCGVSSDLCHPSCPADDSSISGIIGNSGGSGGNGVGSSENVNPTDSQGEPAVYGSKKRWKPVVASILGVAGVIALAGVAYTVVAQNNAAAAEAATGGDAASLSSIDTPLA
jgi:hypothetical protein